MHYIVSEWLINYEGGFTKRGLIGQIAINISDYLIKFKTINTFFQIVSIGIILSIINKFFKKLEFNKIILLSILLLYFFYIQLQKLKS